MTIRIALIGFGEAGRTFAAAGNWQKLKEWQNVLDGGKE